MPTTVREQYLKSSLVYIQIIDLILNQPLSTVTLSVAHGNWFCSMLNVKLQQTMFENTYKEQLLRTIYILP